MLFGSRSLYGSFESRGSNPEGDACPGDGSDLTIVSALLGRKSCCQHAAKKFRRHRRGPAVGGELAALLRPRSLAPRRRPPPATRAG